MPDKMVKLTLFHVLLLGAKELPPQEKFANMVKYLYYYLLLFIICRNWKKIKLQFNQQKYKILTRIINNMLNANKSIHWEVKQGTCCFL